MPTYICRGCKKNEWQRPCTYNIENIDDPEDIEAPFACPYGQAKYKVNWEVIE